MSTEPLSPRKGHRFGRLVRKLREYRRMSQLEVALRVPMDVSYLSLLENGKRHNPGANVLHGLAKALRLSGPLLVVFMTEAAMSRGLLDITEETEDFDLILRMSAALSDEDDGTRARLRGSLRDLIDRLDGSEMDFTGDKGRRSDSRPADSA